MARPVGTLVKTMKLLDALAERGPMGVMELSRRLDLEKSSVSRLLATLRSYQIVLVDDNGQYDLGLRLSELGQQAQNRMPFRRAIIPIVDALARETTETAFAVHYSHGDIAYLYECVSAHDVRLGERTGMRLPPWNHVAGVSILAQWDDTAALEELAVARQRGHEQLPTPDGFRGALSRVRRRGYAWQRDAESCLIAVPLLTRRRPVSFALMVGGPSFRIKQSMVPPLAEVMMRTASQAARHLA